MSASLVGSEMCIRHRTTTESQKHAEVRPCRPVGVVNGKTTSSMTAVSYTHLTLPTICSV
eukprot:2396334-Alexandrium_andersonii.AAC.1